MSTSPAAVDVGHEAGAPALPKRAARSKRPLVMGAIVAALLLGGGGIYVSRLGLETTDDAQVDAEMVSVPTRTSGLVAKVLFAENEVVKAGQLLAELDAEPAKARFAQAEAALEAARASAEAADADARVAETNARGNKSVAEASLQGASSSATASRQQIAEGEAMVASAQANRDKAATDLDRARSLLDSRSIAQAEFDRTKQTADVAAAQLDQARAHLASARASTSQAQSRVVEANAKLVQSSNVDAQIELAHARARMAHAQVATAQAVRDLSQLDLSYTHILAPQDGVVSKKTIAVGQMVAPGQGIGQLVPTQTLWITANFKETQLKRMRPGQPVHIDVDAFPGLRVVGEVESFSAATGARFSLLPPDNASGNFTKVVQRVPVRIKIKDVPPEVSLRPGMSADVSVDTRR